MTQCPTCGATPADGLAHWPGCPELARPAPIHPITIAEPVQRAALAPADLRDKLRPLVDRIAERGLQIEPQMRKKLEMEILSRSAIPQAALEDQDKLNQLLNAQMDHLTTIVPAICLRCSNRWYPRPPIPIPPAWRLPKCPACGSKVWDKPPDGWGRPRFRTAEELKEMVRKWRKPKKRAKTKKVEEIRNV